ncbi:hypothetical protein ACJRO7_021630 [Eucalyptus globulus]|uniref:TIR domain-containing protein n=1 Tax=Eucalyptus globulus TaxID=34317 RepID=A0ABD3KMY5_EUCGL
MHHQIFGHSFAEFVALILLPGLAFYFLNKMKASVHGNAKDVDTGASGLMTTSTETNSGVSSSTDLMTTSTETNSGGSSSTESNNGASSSLIASTENCYEVFLNFRGSDTRKGFTDHLYHGLRNAGIDVFRDNNELSQGKNIRPELLAAITKSKILIPILSEKYGTSSWCLDELVQIMECKNNNGQIVLPIFYKVKPTEVRNQTGKFGDAFRERERCLRERSSFDPTILGKWKKALDEVSTLKGYEADGYEAKLVKSVVRKALSELKKNFELGITENLVGIDSHVKEVMEFMDNKSHATLFVGIHGMGGIGKTTLAKAIYNKLSNQFEHRSFIADIRESWKRGVRHLQKQLINDLLNGENEVRNEDEGTWFISSKFKGKKVLVLLDDVDNVVQLEHLARYRDWFSLGSRIIITTRNKRILEKFGVDYDYDHKEMDNSQSLILFSKHAFRMDSPPGKFEDLTQEVVSITGGLPLSIEVFGSLLCGKETAQWRDTINKLKKIPNMEVQERLRISYEALDDQQKEIFLDIACFFIGTDKRIASYMWEACDFFPGEGIEALRFMSLIKIVNDHELVMHDQLRDLGREIVRKENQRQPQYRSRLWDSEEALKVLKDHGGTDEIEAINLSEGSTSGFATIFYLKEDGDIYTEKQFKNLTNLRYLHMIKAHLSGDFKDLMKGLKWLQWRICPTSFEVNNFDVKELVVLELQGSNINEKWGGWSFFKMAKKLKYLDLSHCQHLENTDFLSAFEKLEVLILQGCTALKRIDASIEDTEGLLRLELCSSYALHLAGGADAGAERPVPRFCLGELPAEIGKLKSLRQLDLFGTPSLSALPNSIGSLENLEILDITWSGIEELPNGIGSLRKLRELRAKWCENLKGILVESMANLSSLRRLDFRDCDKLQSLPELPSGLTDLGVTCQSRKLPSLSHLAHLKELVVHGCDNLQCIQELPSTQLKSSKCSQPTDIEESESPQSLNTPFKLEVLNVSVCESIKMLDVSQFVHLRTLDLCNIPKLLEVRGLDKLMYLESLTIESRNSIKRLDLPKFGCLKKLNVDGSNEFLADSYNTLTEIQGLDRSEFLERLDINDCVSIGRLDVPKSGRLKELEAIGCENLAEIEGLDRSEYLESLDISWCTSIGRLDLPKFGMLKKLEARHCKKLAEIQGLDSLEYLESLDISRCISIGRLDLPKFGMLKKLEAQHCKNLAEIQGLDSLEYLESLDISRCTSIGRLDLPKSGSMKRVNVGWCKKLAEIHGLDRLESLEILEISWCTSIERLLLPKSGSLKRLEARDCKNLVEIRGLDRLEFLEKLNIIGCKSLKKIPELSGTQIYRYYQITYGEDYEPCPYWTDDSDEE